MIGLQYAPQNNCIFLTEKGWQKITFFKIHLTNATYTRNKEINN